LSEGNAYRLTLLMKTNPSFRRLLVLFALLALSLLPALAADPSGTWRFTAEGPNGRALESTLVLRWENGKLAGHIHNRGDEATITDGRFENDEVAFAVERRIRGRRFVIRYAGRVQGDTIVGTIATTGRKKQAVELPWRASRESATVTGSAK